MRLQISDDESALKPVVHWHDEPDRGYNQVKLCTWDRAGLFSKIAGCFSATGLNILTAQVFTRMDGIALDTWAVTDARSGSPAGEEQRQKFEELLNKALNGDQVKFESLITRQKSTRPVYQAYSGEQIPTQVRFDNEASETRTLVEIETEDRLGLLYAMARVFTELSLDIVGAKILTERGAAIDSFYIREVGGLKVTTPERQKAIERKLRQALAALAPQ
jgi:[protein-PII] uridylyltransferase